MRADLSRSFGTRFSNVERFFNLRLSNLVLRASSVEVCTCTGGVVAFCDAETIGYTKQGRRTARSLVREQDKIPFRSAHLIRVLCGFFDTVSRGI